MFKNVGNDQLINKYCFILVITMDKKDERRLKPELPLSTKFEEFGAHWKSDEISNTMKNEIAHEQFQIGPKPEIVEKLMIGRNESAKSFMEADLDRLRDSIKMDQIKPKFQMLSSDQMMNAEKDLRTGASDIRSTLPKTAKIEDSHIPMHPELALAAAMKKLNQRSIQ